MMNITSTQELTNKNSFNSLIQKQIVFIDSQVENYSVLAEGVLPGIEVIKIDSDRDGIQQITAVLSQKSNYTSIHIVSHGSPGCLYLGNTQLSLDTFNNYQQDLKTWFSNSPLLPGEGQGERLLIYGCNVAAGDAGTEFITKLHNITGAEIAASTTPVGNADLGGNWELDKSKFNRYIKLAFNTEVQTNYPNIFMADEKFSLGNRVWQDTNNNGEIDNGESGLDGVDVNLYEDTNNDNIPDGAVIATTTTADGGYYRFDNLDAGDYVIEIAASNFNTNNALDGLISSTTDEVEPDDNTDINDNGIGIFPNATNGIRSNSVTLDPGFNEPTGEDFVPPPTTSTSIDLGQTETTGGDGTAVRMNGVDSSNASSTTGRITLEFEPQRFIIDVAGFGNDLTGFCLEFAELSSPDLNYTAVNAATTGPFFNSSYNDPDDIPNFYNPGATPDPNSIPADYGIITQDELNIISTVWANVENTLLTSASDAAALQLLIWEIQNDQTFNLTSGNFILDATGGSTSTINANTSAAITKVNSWYTNATNGTWTGSVPLALLTVEDQQDIIVSFDLDVGATDSQSNLTVDFGFFTPATITGNVGEDTTGDNAGNLAISGVILTLVDTNGASVATQATDSNGNYTFSNVAPGDYTIVQTQPEGLASIAENEGGTDNDAGNTTLDNVIAVTVAAGDTDTGNDFVEGRVSIGSTVFNDTDNSGTLNGAETGISNVTVQLFDTNGTEIEVGADGILGTADDGTGGVVTDSNGNYFFDGLAPGDYQVRIPESNFATNGALENTSSSSTNTDIADNSEDNDNNGIQNGGAGTVVNSPNINLAIGGEISEAPGAIGGDQDNTRDASGDMTVDFGFVDLSNVDYGDAPDSISGTLNAADNLTNNSNDFPEYQTRLEDGGAAHIIDSNLQLGANLDADSGSLQNNTATADNLDGTPDDEDGITFNTVLDTDASNYSVTVDVTNNNATEDATLIGWIDFNQDGIFESTEAISQTITANSGQQTTTLDWTGLSGVSGGTTYARFRLSTDPSFSTIDNDTSIGLVGDGEVEDYQICIADIIGTDASDDLRGSETTGNDVIAGYKGQDTLSGGGGSDKFLFNETSDGLDVITDFTPGEDKIVLTQIFANELSTYTGTNPINDDYLVLTEITHPTLGASTFVQIDFDAGTVANGDEGLYHKDIAFLPGVAANSVDIDDFII